MNFDWLSLSDSYCSEGFRHRNLNDKKLLAKSHRVIIVQSLQVTFHRNHYKPLRMLSDQDKSFGLLVKHLSQVHNIVAILV